MENFLSVDWKPGFGKLYVWFAMDKIGNIAMMVNNCWGDIPKVILSIDNIEEKLETIEGYVWGDIEEYEDYSPKKEGGFYVDLYSSWRYSTFNSRDELEKDFIRQFKEHGRSSEVNMVINKGVFVFYAVEGSCEGDDYPVGYDKKTKMGDYYSFLVPTKFSSIEDFPLELRHFIAVSDRIIFSEDKIIDNDRIDELFIKTYI